MADRKAELERKKAKLQALREDKERRKREKERKEAQEAAVRASNAPRDDQQDLDKMLSSLGVAPVSEVLSSMSSMSSEPGQDLTGSPDKSLEGNATASPRTPSKRPPQLSVVSVQATNIPPRETVTYTKGVQTSSSGDGHG